MRIRTCFGLGALLVLVLSGCTSAGRREAERPAPQPLLFGRSTFFSETLAVEALLGPFRLHRVNELDRTPPGPGEGEPIPVTGGTFGGRAEREAGAGFPRGPGEQGAFGGREPGMTGARARGGQGPLGGPRQTVTVTLRSLSSEPVTVRVVEVKSALGNFVPVPEQFTLPPGGAQELEAMNSSYDAPIDELELLVSLRVGGRNETQVIKLLLAEP